jgi:hypothetical protein
MGRKSSWSEKRFYEERAKKKRLHPAWRGVGCIVIALLGLAAYYFSGTFIQSGVVFLPSEVRYALSPPLPPDVFVRAVVAFLFMLVCFTILSFVYALAFPIEPGEHDLPLPRRRPRRRR